MVGKQSVGASWNGREAESTASVRNTLAFAPQFGRERTLLGRYDHRQTEQQHGNTTDLRLPSRDHLFAPSILHTLCFRLRAALRRTRTFPSLLRGVGMSLVNRLSDFSNVLRCFSLGPNGMRVARRSVSQR